MGDFVIKGRPAWLGSYDFANQMNALAIDYGVEAQDNTILNDSTRSNKGGIFTFGFAFQGFSDHSLADEESFSNIGSNVPLTSATFDGTEQEIAYLINVAQLQTVPLTGAVGDMAGLEVNGNSADRLIRGVLELNATKTVTGVSTGLQQGAVSAAEKIYANLHVTAASGSSPTLDAVIQSDDNGSFTSATSRITFTQATGITSEHLSLAGAITDDYWRVSFTIGGGSPSFTFAVSFGII